MGPGPGQGVVALAVAADWVLVALPSGRVRGFLARRPAFWLTPPAPASALGASADGRHLLVTSARGNNWVYSLTGREPALHRKWERKTGRTEGLTHDGRMLVRGDVRGQVRGYELEGYKLKWLAKAERLAMSPDGRWALLAQGRTMSVHEGETGKQKGASQFVAGQIAAMALVWADHLAWVEEAGGVCTLRLSGPGPGPGTGMGTGTGTGIGPERVPCHPRTTLAFSPGGGLLALALGSEAQLRDGRSGRLLAEHRRVRGALLVAPLDDTTYVVVGLDEGKVTWLRLPPGPSRSSVNPRPSSPR